MPRTEVEPEEEKTTGKAKKKIKPLILILILLVVLAAAGAGAWFFFFRDSGGEGKEKHEKAEVFHSSPQQFTVNLADPDRYLRTAIVMESEEEEIFKEGFKEFEPPLRDAFIQILRSKKSAELDDAEGSAQLKKELVEAANHVLGEEIISGLYFQEFIIE